VARACPNGDLGGLAVAVAVAAASPGRRGIAATRPFATGDGGDAPPTGVANEGSSRRAIEAAAGVATAEKEEEEGGGGTAGVAAGGMRPPRPNPNGPPPTAGWVVLEASCSFFSSALRLEMASSARRFISRSWWSVDGSDVGLAVVAVGGGILLCGCCCCGC